MDKSPALGISFNEAPPDPGVQIHSKENLFIFDQCSLRGMTLESGFLPCPNYVSSLLNEQTATG